MPRPLFRAVFVVIMSTALLLAQPSAPGVAAPVSPAVATMIARAKALELPTAAVPPPGDPLEHHAAGLAKVICSAVFITGLEPEFALENLGYFTAPYAQRARLGKPVIDREKKAVHVTLPNGTVRTALYLGDQGCVALPPDKTTVDFTPVTVARRDSAREPWPMGDVLSREPLPQAINSARLNQALDAALARPEGLTAGFVITWKGRLLGERYGPGITPRTQLESWSMGKSVTATLLGVLMQQGVYTLDQRAPVPEWQGRDDPRRDIRIRDLMQMSSGLRIRAPQDPDYDPTGPYPEHVYLYTGAANAFDYAAKRPLQYPPGTVGRYRNTDPVIANYLIRLAVERRGEEYLSFPQRALFDKIGVRSMIIETDTSGNLLTQGYDYATPRDWARLGNLYLQDGVWSGERLLPKGFVDFVRTVAPAWAADNRLTYGGFFMINGDGRFPTPKDTYFMAGAGGQWTLIIPSHDLVVVRMGHFKGEKVGEEDLKRALELLLEAVPAANGGKR